MWPRMSRRGRRINVAAVMEEERREASPVRSIGRERRTGNRRGLEQTAASQEKVKEAVKGAENQNSGENWLQDLNPEQKRVLGRAVEGVYIVACGHEGES